MFSFFFFVLACFLPGGELAIVPIGSGDVFDFEVYDLMHDD
jgi:hypothetical protein